MKNFVISLAILAFAGLAFADKGPVGRVSTLDNTGAFAGPDEQWFINVKNVSGGALEDGDVVILDTTEDDGYSVTTSTTAGAVPHCVLNEACADDAMCECQTFGFKSNANFDSTNANATAGELAFISENNAGDIQGDDSPAATDRPVGVFFDSASASADVELFIRLR